MTPDLTTTNVFLGIMAAVSLLQVLAVIGVFVGAFVLYRRVLRVVDGIERRHVAPAAARVNAILDDVKGVTSTVKRETGQITRLVEWIFETVSRKRHEPRDEPPNEVL